MLLKKFIKKSEFDSFHQTIKLTQCPYCKKIGFLILFGYLRGNDEKHIRTKKAHRVFCSNRNNRTGCGKTFSVYYSNYIKNLFIGADIGWRFLEDILNGKAIYTAYLNLFQFISLTSSTLFRFWKKFKLALFEIRTHLYLKLKLSSTCVNDSIKETIEHLSKLSNNPLDCPIAIYQETFQKSLI